MTVKTIDTKGRVALGAHVAGQIVTIDDSEPDRFVITIVKAIPMREAWLYENEAALNKVRGGLQDARAGRFAKSTPDLAADAALLTDTDD
jgi:hypothetical protein